MCLIGDFVLTSNEGLKLQATGCLLKRGFKRKKDFNYKKEACEIYHYKVHSNSFKKMNWLKWIAWIFPAILGERVISWAEPHTDFIYQ